MTLTFQANSDDEELDELELRRIALASAIPRMEDSSQLPDETSSHDVAVHSASEESDKSAHKGKVDENSKPRSSNYQASRRLVASREAARRRHHSVEGGYYWCYYPHAFLKKRRGYCNRLCPSVPPSVRLSVMLSPPKPLDEIQPNLVCELLT